MFGFKMYILAIKRMISDTKLHDRCRDLNLNYSTVFSKNILRNAKAIER